MPEKLCQVSPKSHYVSLALHSDPSPLKLDESFALKIYSCYITLMKHCSVLERDFGETQCLRTKQPTRKEWISTQCMVLSIRKTSETYVILYLLARQVLSLSWSSIFKSKNKVNQIQSELNGMVLYLFPLETILCFCPTG